MTHFDQNITFSAGHGAPQNETKSPNKPTFINYNPRISNIIYLNIIIFNFQKCQNAQKTRNFQIFKRLGAPQE